MELLKKNIITLGRNWIDAIVAEKLLGFKWSRIGDGNCCGLWPDDFVNGHFLFLNHYDNHIVPTTGYVWEKVQIHRFDTETAITKEVIAAGQLDLVGLRDLLMIALFLISLLMKNLLDNLLTRNYYH